MKQIKRVNNGRVTGGFILLVFLYSSQFYRHKCKCCIHIKIKINIILAQKREFLDLHQDQLAYWEWDKRPIEDVIRKACTRENESIVNWKLRHPTFNLSVNSSFIWNLTHVFLPDTVLGDGKSKTNGGAFSARNSQQKGEEKYIPN